MNLLEIPAAGAAVGGVVMELNDCAFATLNKVTATSDANVGFKDCDFAMLVGARPRGPGMERKDLLLENAKIFSAQGKALDAVASRDVRVLVVGNPANTNSLIAQKNAKSLNPKHFTAMTRLDHNRGLAQLTEKTAAALADVKKIIIWGNHSATQYPDLHHATVAGKRRCRWWIKPGSKTITFPRCSSAAPPSSRRAAPPRPHRLPPRRSIIFMIGCWARLRVIGSAWAYLRTAATAFRRE